MGLRWGYDGVTMGLRRDGLEIRRWSRSLDCLSDAMSLLETRALSGASMPLWRRSPCSDDRASPLFIPLGLHRAFRK